MDYFRKSVKVHGAGSLLAFPARPAYFNFLSLSAWVGGIVVDTLLIPTVFYGL